KGSACHYYRQDIQGITEKRNGKRQIHPFIETNVCKFSSFILAEGTNISWIEGIASDPLTLITA
ncbi:MAG: hypothetical protein CV080_07775, partial [Candidatus Kuenenia stuttgartiensis]